MMKLNTITEKMQIVNVDTNELVNDICRQLGKQLILPEIDTESLEQRLDFENLEVYFEDEIIMYFTGVACKEYVKIPLQDDGSIYDLTDTDILIEDIAVTKDGNDVQCTIQDVGYIDSLIEKIQNNLKETL